MDRLDVSGVWYGGWRADDPRILPGRFIALLREMGGVIAGESSEPGRKGGTLGAILTGHRDGTSIAWTKQYDGASRLAHAVRYEGHIGEGGTEISGQWRFAAYSGTFTMVREIFSQEELEADEEIALRV